MSVSGTIARGVLMCNIGTWQRECIGAACFFLFKRGIP